MFPELFKIPVINLTIPTYGAALSVGVILALVVTLRQSLACGKYYNEILDFFFWGILGGVLGARILFIIVERETIFTKKTSINIGNIATIKIPQLFTSGLIFWGGLIGGGVAFVIFSQKRSLPKLIIADMLILGVPLAQSIGRIGCFCAGCCWGQSVDSLSERIPTAYIPFVEFPKGSIAYQTIINKSPYYIRKIMEETEKTIPLFPSQLAESIGTLFIFFILLFINSRKKFHGQILVAYLFLYSAIRIILELFRGDDERGHVFHSNISTSQFISAVVMLAAITIYIKIRNISNNIE